MQNSDSLEPNRSFLFPFWRWLESLDLIYKALLSIIWNSLDISVPFALFIASRWLGSYCLWRSTWPPGDMKFEEDNALGINNVLRVNSRWVQQTQSWLIYELSFCKVCNLWLCRLSFFFFSHVKLRNNTENKYSGIMQSNLLNRKAKVLC